MSDTQSTPALTVPLSITVFIALNTHMNRIEATLIDMSQYGYIPIETYTHNFEYKVPKDFNPLQREIDSIQNQILAVEERAKKNNDAVLIDLNKRLAKAKEKLANSNGVITNDRENS